MSVFAKKPHASLMNSGLDAFQWVAQKNALMRLNEDTIAQIREIKLALKDDGITLDQAQRLIRAKNVEYKEKRVKILAAKIGGEAGSQ